MPRIAKLANRGEERLMMPPLPDCSSAPQSRCRVSEAQQDIRMAQAAPEGAKCAWATSSITTPPAPGGQQEESSEMSSRYKTSGRSVWSCRAPREARVPEPVERKHLMECPLMTEPNDVMHGSASGRSKPAAPGSVRFSGVNQVKRLAQLQPERTCKERIFAGLSRTGRIGACPLIYLKTIGINRYHLSLPVSAKALLRLHNCGKA